MVVKTSATLRIYRGPDDDGPDSPLSAAERPAPWWAGRRHLSVGEFLSAFRPGDYNAGVLGGAVRRYARELGRDGEAVRGAASATFPSGVNRWPVDLLCDFFHGKLIGGVLIDVALFKDMAPVPSRAAA